MKMKSEDSKKLSKNHRETTMIWENKSINWSAAFPSYHRSRRSESIWKIDLPSSVLKLKERMVCSNRAPMKSKVWNRLSLGWNTIYTKPKILKIKFNICYPKSIDWLLLTVSLKNRLKFGDINIVKLTSFKTELLNC